MNVHLFRIQVYYKAQIPLFDSDLSPPQMIKNALLSYPELSLDTVVWHVGNVEALGDDGFYFRIGKTTRVSIESYKDHKFIEEESEVAPSTPVLLDIRLEVCGIAPKTALAPTPLGIARKLAALLNGTSKDAEFVVTEIQDPDDFLSALKSAYSISRFWMTLSRPNAFDATKVEEAFKKLVDDANAETGRLAIAGKTLDPDVVEPLARSAAATGSKAGATLKPSQRKKPITKQLGRNPVVVRTEIDDLGPEESKEELLDEIRESYHKVRETREEEPRKPRKGK